MPSPEKLARRLARVERDVLAVATKPQLRYSSIDGGSLELRDIHGNTTGYVGQQFDGTFTSAPVGGSWPSSPSQPLIEPTIGGLKMYWDGTYSDGSLARMDFKRITFHAVTDLADLDILSPSQMVGEITTAAGGESACWLPPIEHYVVAVAWTEAGKFSEPSDPSFATPLAGSTAEQWAEHEAALADRVRISNDVTQPSGLGPDDRVLWYDPTNDNAISYWDGSTWGPYPLGGGAIAPSAIDTIHLNAGSVTADILDTEVLRAGMTITGRIQVGESYWTPTEGLVIPQPDGSATRFPADGVTSAQISGHAKLKSATIEKDFNLLGTTNQVAGVLRLANGITPPTSAPSLYPSWDTRIAATLDSAALGVTHAFRGAASAPNSSHFAVGINYFGTGIRLINKTTGAWQGDPTDGKTWADGFIARGGMGFANSHYFFYGHDSNRSDGWYVYKVDASYNKVSELYVGPYAAHNANTMSLTASSATGGVYLAFCNDANQIILRTWDTNLGFLSDVILYTAGAGRNIDALYVGAADYGTNKVLVAEREAGVVYGWTLSGVVRDDTVDFPMGNGAKIQGLHYDSTLGKLISFDQNGRVVHYSSAKNARTVTGSYTWYDGDGTVRETTPSPSQSVVFGARTLVNIETPPAPDSGVTDPTRVDKANRIGIYLGTGAAARRRQIYLGVDGSGVSIRKHTADIITTNLNVEPVTNTFGGANVPPGSLVSAAVDGLGAPKTEILGDGSVKVGTLSVAEWKSVDVPWTNLTNTLAVGAVQYAVRAGWVSVRINATAATASGTTYTTVTSGIPSVLRPTKNTRGPCDFSGFPGSIVVTPSGSILFAHNSGANRAAVEGFVTWPIE